MNRKQPPRVARQKTRQMDEVLTSANVPSRPRVGWIAAIRQALGMSKTQLARRMGVARQSLDALESNEIKGTITLASMRNAADALGCDLQYVLIPRKPLKKMISEQARLRAGKKLARVNQSQALEASSIEAGPLSQAIIDLATEFEVTRPADLWND